MTSRTLNDPSRYWSYFGVYTLWTAFGFVAGISIMLLLRWLLGSDSWPWPVVLALPFFLAGFPASATYGLRHRYAVGHLPNRVFVGPGHKWRNHLGFVVYALGIAFVAWFVLRRVAA